MYNNYTTQSEARKLRRELKAYKITCGIMAIIFAIFAIVMLNDHDNKQHTIYALQNNCEWHYLYNGMEVCK